MDSNDIIYSYSDENNAIQYAGYPINKYVENGIKTGGYGNDVGKSRFDGLTVPIGLYTYKYSKQIEETPNTKVEIEVIEEPRYQRLISLVSESKGFDSATNKRRTRTKRQSKKNRKTRRG
jgi:hypothetical protein